MSRPLALASLLALFAALGAHAGSVRAEADGAHADWPQSRLDARNTAAVVLEAPSSPTPRTWSFDGSGRTWNYQPGMTVWSSPALAVVEGRAVACVGSYDRNLYCLDAATGELLWKHTTGGAVYSAPTIWNDGERAFLFATATDRLVYALDAATGRQVWVHSVEKYRSTIRGARLSSAVVGTARGQAAVFVGHWVADSVVTGKKRGGMIALGAREGRTIWNVSLGDNQITAPIYIGKDDGVADRAWLLAGSHSSTLYALDADTGEVQWTKGEHHAVRSPPAFARTARGPMVITASMYGAVRGLDLATGAEVWSKKTGDRITGSPAVFELDGSLRVAIGSYDRRLYVLDAETGEEVWRYKARGGIYSSPAILAQPDDPLVLASAWDHALHAVSLRDGATRYVLYTGRPLWPVSGLDESNWSSPALARVKGEWIAFVGSYDGTLRALLLAEAEHSPGPPRSNLAFWLSFPIVLAPVGALAILLTRRERQARRRRKTRSQKPTTRKGTARTARK